MKILEAIVPGNGVFLFVGFHLLRIFTCEPSTTFPSDFVVYLGNKNFWIKELT